MPPNLWYVVLENENGYHIEEASLDIATDTFLLRVTMTDRIVDWISSREKAEKMITEFLQDG